VALLEALAVVHRVGVGPPALHAHATHEAAQDAPARDEIGHRDLLGHLDRVLLDREDIAEDQQLRPLGRPRQDSGGHVGRHVDAGGRRVVLVDHEAIEPGLVGEVVLVEIALVVELGDLRREERVGEGQAQ